MYQLKPIDDLIAAIATPAGEGGIGIVRASGQGAFAAADRIFKTKSGVPPSACPTFTVHYGWVVDDGRVVDEALLTVMRGPKSYTGQDVVEISCHGGAAVLRATLQCLLNAGARLAEPGEFTKRAFLNGRIDLTQAEAVLDIIQARTEQFARVSQNQLNGDLSRQLQEIRDGLMEVYTLVEALINFPEDDTEVQSRAEITGRLERHAARIADLLASAHNGRILKDGIRIVLCGKPNVGKSSLLNALLKQDRAIVTAIAGTTRDVLEESAQIQGVPLQLVDTAGILEPRDLIEEEAVRRSHVFINGADLVLLVLDASRPPAEDDRALMRKLAGRPVLLVLNKSDLPAAWDEASLPEGEYVRVSALRKDSLVELEGAMIRRVWQGRDIDTRVLLISNIRHVTALKAAHGALAEGMAYARATASWEIVSQTIKDAVNQLDAITGRNIDQDLLDTIFAQFCIGK